MLSEDIYDQWIRNGITPTFFLRVIFQTVVLIFIVVSCNVLATVSSGLPQVSLVYLGVIQPGKSFLKSVDQTRHSRNIKMLFK